MKIPFCFKDKSEDYLTKPVLQKFCNENNLPTSEDKIELIKYIEEFANKNTENEKMVLEWLEVVLKEGVKHILARKCYIPKEYVNTTFEEWEKLIDNKFEEMSNSYLIYSKHINKIQYLSFVMEENANIVETISFTCSILLAEKKLKNSEFQYIIYPIFVDIDVKNGYIIGRAKSKSNIYEYTIGENGKKCNNEEKANTFKLIRRAVESIASILDIQLESKDKAKDRWGQKFYKIIEECTKTPKEISDIIVREEKYIDSFINNFFDRNEINPILGDNYKKAKEDLEIFIEKYLATNIGNEDIFKEDRYGYPVRIAATDTDLTSVEQSSFNKRPLQATSVFYDNKKILVRRKQCDRITLLYKRDKQKYMSNDEFLMTGEIKKGYCVIQSLTYLLEEDIQDVLSRIIRD